MIHAPGRRPRWPAAIVLVTLLLTGAGEATAGLKDDLSAAEALVQRGDRAGGAAAFARIVERHGDNPEARSAYYHLALLSVDGLEYIRYLDLFLEHGGRKDRRGSEVELMAGRFYFTQGDFRTALRRFESARDIARGDADKAETAYWIGLSLVALQEFSDARGNLLEAAKPAERGRWREEALFALGELERNAGDFEAAASAYRNCLSAFPDGAHAPAALLGEATARELLGDSAAARALLSRLVADWAGSPEAATARGRLKAATGSSRPDAVEEAQPEHEEVAGYGVQVGAFAREANALKLADDLNRLGYAGVRIDRAPDGDRLYHVRFGPFPDEVRAERAGDQVTASLGLRYRIVRPEDNRP